jgi:hypothetical protein
MVVEAAMREARIAHQIRDADAVEALLAKQSGGGLDDPRLVFIGLLFGDAHVSSARIDASSLMTYIIVE